MCPDRVDDQSEQSKACEEEDTLGKGHMNAKLCPVGEANPPHVVGEHHATVKGMDHHPLVSSPEQGVGPTGLWGEKQIQNLK